MKTGRTILFSIFVFGFFSLGLRMDDGASYKALAGPHNIYLYDSLLIISDSSTGIHIYSVKNESSPVFKQRIPLGGNTGIAMKENILFANSFGRILAIRLTSNTTYEIASIIKEDPYWHSYSDEPTGWGCGCASSTPVQPYASGSSGIGGSYAIFAVIDSFLYYLDNSSIITMSISKPDSPVKLNETYLDWSVETLFPTQKYLFIGSRTGMYIFDRSNPSRPVQVGTVTHFKAYDPVVVQDTTAYVTLRTGWNIWPPQDELLMVNIANPAQADTIASKPLATPYGLAVSDSLLYVAQGKNGYSLLNVKDPYAVTVVRSWQSPYARDFIWLDNRLYLMGLMDVRIYDVSDATAPVLLSTIQ
jgi:hypothetical protein